MAKKAMAGARLRRLRRQHGQTQAEMADALGVSTSYVNLIENDQRGLSDQMLAALSETYGPDWHALTHDDHSGRLADLRAMLDDPLFSWDKPDLRELHDAMEHSPRLVEQILTLYKRHSLAVEEVQRLTKDVVPHQLDAQSPERAIQALFHLHSNYFDELEHLAERIREAAGPTPDDLHFALKNKLTESHGVKVRISAPEVMGHGLRFYDNQKNTVHLSRLLDQPDRCFQLAHVIGIIEHKDALSRLASQADIASTSGAERCQAALADYFAAAVMMPYAPFLSAAERTQYDLDLLAAEFGASVEQVAQRLTTMQRKGASGIPFFFVRLDRAGNVSKRLNSTSLSLAEFGGSCAVWNIHATFNMPGAVLPQFLELPDGDRCLTLSRTTERPIRTRETDRHRLAFALGCDLQYADKICYTRALDIEDENLIARAGNACHLCPRRSCPRRAQSPLITDLPFKLERRGETKFES